MSLKDKEIYVDLFQSDVWLFCRLPQHGMNTVRGNKHLTGRTRWKSLMISHWYGLLLCQKLLQFTLALRLLRIVIFVSSSPELPHYPHVSVAACGCEWARGWDILSCPLANHVLHNLSTSLNRQVRRCVGVSRIHISSYGGLRCLELISSWSGIQLLGWPIIKNILFVCTR